MEQTRCKWCNLKNPLYVKYHDEEWGRSEHSDRKLFELLLLEFFQAGLSWETVLNKREHFRTAFDNFEPGIICHYDSAKIKALHRDPSIIRNRRKIEAAICNAGVFLQIQREFGSFNRYIWQFTENKVIYESGKTASPLSDKVTDDLKRRGMKFLGTTIVYSFLQAAGVVNSHEAACFMHQGNRP